MMRLIACLLYSFILLAALPAMAEESLNVSVSKPLIYEAPTAVPTTSVPTTTADNLRSPQPDSKNSASEFGWELDPYYSNISLHIPLTNVPIPEFSGKNELQVYRKLFFDSLIPRFMLVEMAVFPMPVTGVALKKYTPEFYRSFNVGSSDFNLLESITAGFQEPYAFSIFFGDMVNFVRPGEDRNYSNKGYMGYMASYSNQHIKRNILIPDHNLEVEWKTKGDRAFKDDKLSWSFRLGAKIHQNPDIANTLYLGFRRNNLDFNREFFSILHNSDLEIRWDFSAKDGRLLRQEYVFGKKFPLSRWRVALRMDAGIIWEDRAMYSGSLRDKDFQNVSAVLRPNLEF